MPFTYDGSTLPTGKTNLRPLTGTPSKYVTAEEWNLVMTAVNDLRASILAGEYHGLATNPTAAVAPATGVRLRSNAGVFEVSAGGAAYAPVGAGGGAPGEIHVVDYGAVGDGVTDDTVALQTAFAAAVNGKLVLLEGGKTYKVTEAIRLGAGTNVFLFLDGRGATIQREGTALPNWAPSTVYAVGNRVIRSVGQRAFEGAFECIKAGTSTTDAALGPKGTTNGIPWAASTAYNIGTERANAGKAYIVTVAGTSAASGGPTGTGTSIVDGTVTWTLGGVADETPWSSGEYYDNVGMRRTNGANLYEVTTPGFSAVSGGPTGAGSGIVDGTVVWSYVSAKTSTVVWKSISDAVLEVSTDVATIKNLRIGAGRLASYGIWLRESTQTLIENVETLQPLFDGFKLYIHSDFVVMFNCQAKLSGRIWNTAGYAGGSTASLRTLVTGTFAKTNGTNPVLTYTASGGSPIADLRTLGLRQGDFVSLHATAPGGQAAEWLQIQNIDSATQITCTQYPQTTAIGSGLQFSLHRGDGFHTGPGRADNNCHAFMTCRSDNSAGAGFRLGGLYGARCHNLLVNVAGSYPIEVAQSNLPSIGTSIHGFYTEADLNGAGGNIFCGGAAGITIDTVNGSNQPVISSEGFNWGTITNMQDAIDPGRIDPIDSATTRTYVPSMVVSDTAVLRGKMFGRSYVSGTTAGFTSIDLDDRDFAGAVRLMSGAEAGGGRSYDTNCHEFDTEIAVVNGVVENAWIATTGYVLGQRCVNGGNIYEVITAGTSAGAGGPTGTTPSVTDGTVVWKFIETGTGVAADIRAKSLMRLRNNGVVKAGIGLEGELRFAGQNDSATAGAATNHMPSGSFAMAAGASSVVITNNCILGEVAWAALTAYTVGQRRSNNGHIYQVTTAGTSAAAGGPTGTGVGIVDGTVTWAFFAVESKVFISKKNNDTTAVDFRVSCGLRSFTVTANANTTAIVKFDFFIVNQVNG